MPVSSYGAWRRSGPAGGPRRWRGPRTIAVGRGGPNVVRDAGLGPLEDKRFATINRIATAIGRNADRPSGLDAPAPCRLAG